MRGRNELWQVRWLSGSVKWCVNPGESPRKEEGEDNERRRGDKDGKGGQEREKKRRRKRLQKGSAVMQSVTRTTQSQRESPALDSSCRVLIFISGKRASKDGGRTSPVDSSPFFLFLSESWAKTSRKFFRFFFIFLIFFTLNNGINRVGDDEQLF